jgi:hypothetical protein
MLGQNHAAVQAFFATPEEGKIPAVVPGCSKVFKADVNTTQGTFLARSSSSTARALAAVMVIQDAREANQK